MDNQKTDDNISVEVPKQHQSSSTRTNNEPNLINNPNTNESIQAKLDEIEQNSYSNVIVCSGDAVNELITANSNQDCKRNFIRKVDEIVPGVTSSDIVSVIPFGKERKCLKVTCMNANIRNTILKEARRKKLPNIFYGEFLTPVRNNLYYQLRALKRRFSEKVKSVYTRNGKIYYKLNGVERCHLVRTQDDVTNLVSRLSDE